ncbi:MAG: CPXCG motif-containing cysteine-rich protein [Ignavibacteriaceae bacterium]|nr:CPXCG motif-containing cysteine-rich protein [Ignavibacteriaceae bacterium]
MIRKKVLPDDDVVWICQYCGRYNTVWVDLTVGKQDFIEECRICCRPNRIIVRLDEDDNVSVESRYTDE